MTQSPIARVTLRVPEDLMRRMRALAQSHDRSLNSELVRAVRAYIQLNSAPVLRPRTRQHEEDA